MSQCTKIWLHLKLCPKSSTHSGTSPLPPPPTSLRTMSRHSSHLQAKQHPQPRHSGHPYSPQEVQLAQSKKRKIAQDVKEERGETKAIQEVAV